MTPRLGPNARPPRPLQEVLDPLPGDERPLSAPRQKGQAPSARSAILLNQTPRVPPSLALEVLQIHFDLPFNAAWSLVNQAWIHSYAVVASYPGDYARIKMTRIKAHLEGRNAPNPFSCQILGAKHQSHQRIPFDPPSGIA